MFAGGEFGGAGWCGELGGGDGEGETGMEGEAPLWLEPLCKIGGVKEMEVCWISREPRVLRMGRTVGIMRRCMLQDDGSRGKEVEQDIGTGSFRFSVLHKTKEDESPTWVEAVLDGDDVQCPVNNDEDMSKTVPSLRTQGHVDSALEFYTDVYVCFCVISCA
jgi:hypothetical protein